MTRMSLSPGNHLGPYSLLSPIGEGGMGEVWKARDTRLDRIVAIKVSKDQFTERFGREAHAVAALNHPNICTLHDVGPNYLVMEFIEGSPLHGPMPVEKAAEYAGQILDALEAAHRKGIVHRDLKPANILLTRQGIKLLDFGLAKRTGPLTELDATEVQGVTQTGQIVGTLQYMSPEQLQGKPADQRSDIFAFGCVLYEMLSGKRAFEGKSSATVIAAILEREPQPLQLTPPLSRVMQTCLAKDPDRRFQSAIDLKRALHWAMENGVEAAALQPQKPSRWWQAAAAALLLTTLGLAALLLMRKPAPTEQPVSFQLLVPPGNSVGSATGGVLQNAARVSPNGKYVIFIAMNGIAKRTLWVRPLNSLRSYQLTDTDEVIHFFFSPDSTTVGYLANEKLLRIKVTGGSSEVVGSASSTFRGDRGNWGANETILIGQHAGPILRIHASGGNFSPITTLEKTKGESQHNDPFLLEDGKHFIYRIFSNVAGNNGIFVGSLDGSPPKRLPIDNIVLGSRVEPSPILYEGGYLFYIRGRTAVAQKFNPSRFELIDQPVAVDSPRQDLAMSLSGNGVFLNDHSALNQRGSLIQVDRNGARRESFGPEAGYYAHVELSPDGKRLAADRPAEQTEGADLWTIDTATKVATRLTFDAESMAAVYSPDGKSMIYSKGKTIASIPSSGGKSELLANVVSHHKHVSPDGQFLAFEKSIGNGGPPWLLSLDSKHSLEAFLPDERGYVNPQFSPDGRWIAYESPGPDNNVFVQSFPAGKGKWQISQLGGVVPKWRGDGRELYYLEQGANPKMMAVGVTVANDAIQLSAPKVLFEAKFFNSLSTRRFAVSKDGQSFYYSTPVEETQTEATPINVYLNWKPGQSK